MKKVIYLAPLLLVFILTGCSHNKQQTEQAGEMPNPETKNKGMMTKVLDDGIYKVNDDLSSIKWKGAKVVGSAHTGTISLKEGTFEVSEGKIIKGRLIADMTTIKSDENLDKLVAHLSNSDFFDVENFAESTLEFDEAKIQDSGLYETEANIQIKDKTNPKKIMFDLKSEDSKFTVVSEFSIDRTLWDIKYGSGKFFKGLGDNMIKDEIEYNLEIVAELQ